MLTRPRTTLFWHLMLGIGGVCLLAIVAATSFLYFRFESTDSRFREGTLRSFAYILAREVQRSGGHISPSISISESRGLHKAGGRFIVVSETGTILAASPGVTEVFAPISGNSDQFFVLPRYEGEGALYGLTTAVPGATPAAYVQVVFPPNSVLFDSVLEEFLVDIGWIWIPFVIAILLTNALVVRVLLRPLAQVVQEAEAIGPGSVSARLTDNGLPQDISVLVKAVNRALDRLQEGFNGLEEFFGDVAHELRTPLAVVKAQLDVSNSGLAAQLRVDFARIERLVQQLLDRVRLGGLHFERGDMVDLSAVAREVCCFLGPIAITRHRSLEVVGAERSVVVNGAYDYVFRALRNLIENALEHTPEGSCVRIGVYPDARISVTDAGPGFFLSKPGANAEGYPRRHGSQGGVGTGLGLLIVERTMSAHQGRLELANAPQGGAVATLCFPQLARLT
ncbi:Adaptive-response sensory-kinase SasA [Labrys miyagiensis]